MMRADPATPFKRHSAAPDRLLQSDGAGLLTRRATQGHFDAQTIRQTSTSSSGSALGKDRHPRLAAVWPKGILTAAAHDLLADSYGFRQ